MQRKKIRSAALRSARRTDAALRGFEHRLKRSPLRSWSTGNRHCSLYLTKARRQGLLTPDCRDEF